MNLIGTSIIGGKQDPLSAGGHRFFGVEPATGRKLEPSYQEAAGKQVRTACRMAAEAFYKFSQTTDTDRAELLKCVARKLERRRLALLERAALETAYPMPRLENEFARMVCQLHFFADIAASGSWKRPRFDPAEPDRIPPRPEIRSAFRPVGPVAVFGASNFPLVISAAGNDVAAALTSGNTVVVKAHPAHPGTNEIIGRCVAGAASDCGQPPGVFALLFGADYQLGKSLAGDPNIRALAFTGSLAGGRALMDLAAARPRPIPVFAEMGSINPVIMLPGVLESGATSLAEGFVKSLTFGFGQLCTCPGVVFLPDTAGADNFLRTTKERLEEIPVLPMLTTGIAEAYRTGVDARTLLVGTGCFQPRPRGPVLLECDVDTWLRQPLLREELFGPLSVIVRWQSEDELFRLCEGCVGQLAISVFHHGDSDLSIFQKLRPILETRAGRLVSNDFPTGVDAGHAMVHGGPYPATSDARATSIGSAAVDRFTRPVAWQR